MTESELDRFNKGNIIQGKLDKVKLLLRVIDGTYVIDHSKFIITFSETPLNYFGEEELSEKEDFIFSCDNFSNKLLIKGMEAFLNALKEDLEKEFKKL